MYVISQEGGEMVRVNLLFVSKDESGKGYQIRHQGVGANRFEYEILAQYETAPEALREIEAVALAIKMGLGVYALSPMRVSV